LASVRRRSVDLVQVEKDMPESATLRRAEQARREGKAPMTQAGESVREEIEHVRWG
jgi:hypothetical protein